MPKRTHWLIRTVDADLVKSSRPISTFVPFFALIVLAMVGRGWSFATLAIVWIPTAAIVLPWFAFVGWRSTRLMRAALWRGDHNYDREGKYRLPPEYADTESATFARKRRWRQRWRQRQERD